MSDRWREVLATLQRNKLRGFLTACGVFWGIFMLITMLGFGDGLDRGVHKSMLGFATNSVYVWSHRTTLPWKGLRPGRHVDFDLDDVSALRRLPGVADVAPRLQAGGFNSGANVVRGAKTGNFNLVGDTPAFRRITTWAFESGRFLNELDLRERRKVAVIGQGVTDVMFARGEDPVGQELNIRGMRFTVIGVFHSTQPGRGADRDNNSIVLPLSTLQQVYGMGTRVGWFALLADPGVDLEGLEKRVRTTLHARHDVHPDDVQALGSFNAARELKKVTTLFLGIKLFTWFVGLMTLMAGVLGVSNIMLIVVKERTREIGIRRAIGATPASIVTMVLQESTFLTALAGYAGVVASVGLLELLGRVLGKGGGPMAAPGIDIKTALVATAVLTVAGAAAGIIPARHAAAIRPVEALRTE